MVCRTSLGPTYLQLSQNIPPIITNVIVNLAFLLQNNKSFIGELKKQMKNM